LSYSTKTLSLFKNKLFVVLIGFILSAIIARLLGPRDLGTLAVIMLIPMFYQKFMSFGLGVSANYMISNKQVEIQEAASTLFYFSIVVGLLPFSFFLIFGIDSVSFLFHDVVISDWYLWPIILTIPAYFLSNFFLKLLLSQENVKVINRVNQIITLLPAACTVFLLSVTDLSLGAAIISYTSVNIFMIPLVLILYFKSLKSLPVGGFKFDIFFHLIRYGYKVFLRNIISFLHYRIDLLLITLLLSIQQVAFYKLAASFAEKIWILNVTHHLLVSRVASSQKQYGKDLTARIFKNTFWLMMILAIGAYFTSSFLISLVYGSEYLSVIGPFKLLLPGVVFLGSCSVLSQYFIGNGLVGWTNYVYLMSIVINVVLNLILIPKYGISGAAIATSITYVLSTIVMIILFIRESSVSLKELYLIDAVDISQYKVIFKELAQSIKI
jgi:O-antigen/teichoic acid export membrane protein